MRANLCVYRELDDPWLKQFRDAPRETLQALMPGLAKITGAYDVSGRVHIRPADLYVTEGVEKPGVVLIGDAFSTSCPTAGTGTGKVFTDVERLGNVYIPRWLATPGMGADKIAAFYADPVRAAYHAHVGAQGVSDPVGHDRHGARLGSTPLGGIPEARRDRDAARAWTAGEAKRASRFCGRHARRVCPLHDATLTLHIAGITPAKISYPRSKNLTDNASRLARRGASTGDAGLMEQAGGAAGDQASGPGAER